MEADIAFHVAVLKASKNPFFAQFQDVAATALHCSMQFTNKIKSGSANVADHAAVKDAIIRGDAEGARVAMRKLIGEVLKLIEDQVDKPNANR